MRARRQSAVRSASGPAAASSRPRARAGSAQSRTVVRWPRHSPATAQLADPVPPPTSVWVAGAQSGAASRSAPRAARTASKVAGIRYAAYAATSERSRSTGVPVGTVPR